jgi:hypothetical protein
MTTKIMRFAVLALIAMTTVCVSVTAQTKEDKTLSPYFSSLRAILSLTSYRLKTQTLKLQFLESSPT